MKIFKNFIGLVQPVEMIHQLHFLSTVRSYIRVE